MIQRKTILEICLKVGLCALFLVFVPVKSQFVNSKPFDNQYFIENKNQWKHRNCDFAYFTGFDNIYIEKGGAGFEWDVQFLEKIERSISPEKKRELIEKNEQEKIISKVVSKLYRFKLLNTSPDATCLAEEKSQHYWTFGTENLNSFGYKKITYKSIYPHIDVIYQLGNPSDGPLKYSFVLHPGANIKDIKIKWMGDNDMKVNVLGNRVDIHGELFDFQDWGLSARTTQGNEIQVVYDGRESDYGFRLMGPERLDQTIIIDPFVKRLNIFKNNNSSFFSWGDFSNLIIMTDFDRNNNLYVMSATLSLPQIAKFNEKGKLLWIFSGEIPAINWSSEGHYPGAIAVDKDRSKLFMVKGRSSMGDYLVRLKLNGNWDQYVYIEPSTRAKLEAWDLQVSCALDKVIVGGGFDGFENNNKNLWALELDGPSTFPDFYHTTKDSTHIWQDVVCSVLDANSNYYSVANYVERYYHYDSVKQKNVLDSSFLRNKITKLNPSLDTIAWQNEIYGTTKFRELLNLPNGLIQPGSSYGITNRNNCLAVNEDYLFLYDGKVLLAFDKSSGKIICTDSISYHTGVRGRLGQSGIAADECNHVFVGGDSAKILVFNFNGKTFKFDTSYQFISNTERSTIDVRLNAHSQTLFVSGDSFVASMLNPFDCKIQKFTVDTGYSPACQGDYWAKASSGSNKTNFIYKWSVVRNGLDSVIREKQRPSGASDTLMNPNLLDTIQLHVFSEGLNCAVDYEFFKFVPRLHDTTWHFDTLCQGEIMTLRNRSFQSDTQFMDRLTNRFGCDSLVNYTLIFKPISIDSFSYHACERDTLKLGTHTISKTGMYSDTFIKFNGCDSILIYRVQFHRDTTISLKYEGCHGDTFEFAGKQYTQTTFATDSFLNFWGCDSVLHRDIVIHPTKDTFIKRVLCKNSWFEYNGRNHTAPADIYDTLRAQNQCDSMVHIQLIPSRLAVDFAIDSSETPAITYSNRSQSYTKLVWHFGDGRVDTTSQDPQHTYNNNEDREIEICLQVSDSFGCRDTLCRKVNIYKLAYILYNAFSPNQDGVNDIHRIGYKGRPFTYNLYIYNRWGALVYQTEKSQINDATQFWNGQVMNTGPDCPSGNYFVIYEFYLPHSGSTPQIVEGVVQLFR